MSACLTGINGAASPHILQAMMAQVSGTLGTCERTLETRVPSCIARPAKPFFILEAHGPQTATGHVAVPEPAWQGSVT
jgi:hypothetical protein